MPWVLIIMGSKSDEDTVRPCMETLKALGISFRATISSAHRSPDRTAAIVEQAEREGAAIFICAAGMAAHLAGAVAARTIRPVLAIPVLGKSLAGMDALFSTVQMPSGFPVATLALNGASNAAWQAAEILALNDQALADRIRQARETMREDIKKAADDLESRWAN